MTVIHGVEIFRETLHEANRKLWKIFVLFGHVHNAFLLALHLEFGMKMVFLRVATKSGVTISSTVRYDYVFWHLGSNGSKCIMSAGEVAKCPLLYSCMTCRRMTM